MLGPSDIVIVVVVRCNPFIPSLKFEFEDKKEEDDKSEESESEEAMLLPFQQEKMYIMDVFQSLKVES